MQSTFIPLFKNPHLLTLAGNFWPRKIDTKSFPSIRKEYRIDARNSVVALEHQPTKTVRAQIVAVHGLEGSANAGYVLSFSQEALKRGFAIHRLNLRTCGGTEELCETMYHSGLTGDTKSVIETLNARTAGPLFLVGFSLGGNVALKLAGELGCTELVAGVIAISTPIDLTKSVRRIDRPANFIYSRRLLDRLRGRIRRKSKLSPHIYDKTGLDTLRTIWEFDDRFTAPLFGFGTAANYYATQSAINFLPAIRVPSLLIVAKDDPLVPFESYENGAILNNPALTVVATQFGGHLGYLSRRKPRFWVDHFSLDWIEKMLVGASAAQENKFDRNISGVATRSWYGKRNL